MFPWGYLALVLPDADGMVVGRIGCTSGCKFLDPRLDAHVLVSEMHVKLLKLLTNDGGILEHHDGLGLFEVAELVAFEALEMVSKLTREAKGDAS